MRKVSEKTEAKLWAEFQRMVKIPVADNFPSQMIGCVPIEEARNRRGR